MKGIIYGLFCDDDDEFYEWYVGSTFDEKERDRTHKMRCNNPNDSKTNYRVYQYIREHGGYDNWTMVILAEVEVESKQELRRIEGQYQLEMGATLNTKMAGRTIKEYRHYYNRQFSEILKEKRKDKSDQKKIYDAEYRVVNKERKQQTNKTYREKNIEKLHQKINCVCGGRYIYKNRSDHEKTIKHKKYIDSIEKKN